VQIETETVKVEEKLLAGRLFRDENATDAAKHAAAMDKHALLLILVSFTNTSTHARKRKCSVRWISLRFSRHFKVLMAQLSLPRIIDCQH
jgi:hypothetical protein